MKLSKAELSLLLNALIVWEDEATFEGEVSLTKQQRKQFKELHAKLFTAYKGHVLRQKSK